MYGTLAGALSARKIRFDRDTYEAEIEGRIEGAGKTIRITEIKIRYKLAVPEGTRPETERALNVHPAGCPAHESVKDAIRVNWEAEIEEF
jgi:uncharacterized OsmC-like protein